MQYGCRVTGLRKTLAQLECLRRRFEHALAGVALTKSSKASAPPRARLREIPYFGTNPGELRMLAHVPDPMPRMPALVVAIHGCTQTADAYDYGTGWSALADRLGFVVIYPEQQPSNNPQKCFSWFLTGDTARERGEALSIRQMIERAIADFGVDRRRVYVTGLSAGGAMTSVMLATYPEVFAGGAIIAGLPYGCATSVQEAFEAMFNERSTSARALGDRVRAASTHQGPWPRVSVWHGSADPIVNPSNAQHVIGQWTDVHGLPDAPSQEEKLAGHLRRIWNDAYGNTIIESFSISGMGHGVPIAQGTGGSYEASGPFFLSVGISSTHQIAQFWGLANVGARARSSANALMRAVPVAARPLEVEMIAGGSASAVVPASAGGGANQRADRQPFDPNAVINAAFNAAGLPPLDSAAQPGLPFSPRPIIEAALRAAGLVRR
jgi:poly(hydroxyalkanoate) depolymerase family esterase